MKYMIIARLFNFIIIFSYFIFINVYLFIDDLGHFCEINVICSIKIAIQFFLFSFAYFILKII